MRQVFSVALSATEGGRLSGNLAVAAYSVSPAGNLIYRAALYVCAKNADSAFPEEFSMDLTFDNPIYIQVWLCVSCQMSLATVLCTPEIRGESRCALCSTEDIKNLMRQFISHMKGFEEKVNEWRGAQKLH